jgi:hypothetical protein
MHFLFRKEGLCQFLKEDLKTAQTRQARFADDKKIWEMAKRGGFTLNIAGRQELQEKIRKGGEGIWLELSAEQYSRLLDGKK